MDDPSTEQLRALYRMMVLIRSAEETIADLVASKLRGDRRVSVAFFGDGATEEGHFHESVNMAAVYRLPVLFVCENNFYSSHMSLLERRRADNIYKTGEAHGIPGIQIDGNDVL